MSDKYKPMVKIDPICIVGIKRNIFWPNYDEDSVTVKQDKELKRLEGLDIIVKAIKVESFNEDLDAFLNTIKESVDYELYPYIYLAISTPLETTEITYATINDIYFTGCTHITLCDM